MDDKTLVKNILDISRQNQIGKLSSWFDKKLYALVYSDQFLTELELGNLKDGIIQELIDYRTQTGVKTATIGMSGGIDSALTAALLKEAGWTVIGVTMPIHQIPSETERGIEACDKLGIDHLHIDLTQAYEAMLNTEFLLDPDLVGSQKKEVRIRRGNIRARLRMITLYNLAAKHKGLVASTDNYSELAAGFWTLHGDVGDLSPIQALLKSWEVPMLARMLGVPESIVKAKPTDGLGVDDGDEAQFGFSYLEFDIMLTAMIQTNENWIFHDSVVNKSDRTRLRALKKELGVADDERADHVFDEVCKRIGGTWFKRMNPVNIQHGIEKSRYSHLANLDQLFQPKVVK